MPRIFTLESTHAEILRQKVYKITAQVQYWDKMKQEHNYGYRQELSRIWLNGFSQDYSKNLLKFVSGSNHLYETSGRVPRSHLCTICMDIPSCELLGKKIWLKGKLLGKKTTSGRNWPGKIILSKQNLQLAVTDSGVDVELSRWLEHLPQKKNDLSHRMICCHRSITGTNTW